MRKRAIINYAVSMSLTLSFFVCFITGLIKWPGLVSMIGVKAYKFLYFDHVSSVHDWSGLIMGVLVIAHIALHFGFMRSMTRRLLFGTKNKASS